MGLAVPTEAAFRKAATFKEAVDKSLQLALSHAKHESKLEVSLSHEAERNMPDAFYVIFNLEWCA